MPRLIIVIFILWLTGAGLAPATEFVAGGDWRLYQLSSEAEKISLSRSFDGGFTFSAPEPFYQADGSLESFSVMAGTDNSFSLSLVLSGEAHFLQGIGGQWERITSLSPTGEAVKEAAYTSREGTAHFLYISSNQLTGWNSLAYTKDPTGEVQVITGSFGELKRPRLAFSSRGPVLYWEEEQLTESQLWLAFSPDNGKTFSTPLAASLPGEGILISIEQIDEEWFGLLFAGTTTLQPLTFSALLGRPATESNIFDLLSPLQINSPGEGDWLKSETSLFFEAELSSPPGWLEDETAASLSLGKALLSEPLYYDAAERKVSGFITLPYLPISEGPVKAEFTLGELKKTFLIQIDQAPPQAAFSPAEPLRSPSSETIFIPLSDAGSGVDYAATTVTLGLLSLEALGPVTGGGLFRTREPLPEGRYLGEILARDRAGNISAPISFTLVIDPLALPLAQAKTLGGTIVSRQLAGPSPFSPRRDGTLYFNCDLADGSADLSLYIFNLTGTLVWKEFAPASTGRLTWNGRDQSGGNLPSGVYTYVIKAEKSGHNELHRGKVILLN